MQKYAIILLVICVFCISSCKDNNVPIPFDKLDWLDKSKRALMVKSVHVSLIGKSKKVVIDSLGEPDKYEHDVLIYYTDSTNNSWDDIFVYVYLNRNSIVDSIRLSGF